MAYMLENYGIDFFAETDETLAGFLGYLTQKGKVIKGYYDVPYFFKSIGNAECWVRTARREDGTLEYEGLETHCGGNCVWEMVHIGIDFNPKDEPVLSRSIMFNRLDGKGMIPINVITADVLPSFRRGDIIKMQMIALPLEIKYYKDENEYSEAQPKGQDGKKWMVGVGSLLPLQFLHNHKPERYEQGVDYVSDLYVSFTATVKKLFLGIFEMDGEKHNTFIRCIAETEFGDLEFDHTIDQVEEKFQDNIKAGAIISGICILSGDAAIYEYDKGVIKDFEHNLLLMRYTFEGGDPQRLATVLSEDVVYESGSVQSALTGREAIINKFANVHKNRVGDNYIAKLATITAVDDPNMDYPIGTRCIALADKDEDYYESLAFITVNEDGMIEKIKISTDSKYHFTIKDENPYVESDDEE